MKLLRYLLSYIGTLLFVIGTIMDKTPVEVVGVLMTLVGGFWHLWIVLFL